MKLAALDLVGALEYLLEEALAHVSAHEDHVLHDVLEHEVLVLRAIGEVSHQELFSVLKRAAAHHDSYRRCLLFFHNTMQALLRVEHLHKEQIDEDLNLFKRKHFAQDEVRKTVAKLAISGRFRIAVMIALALLLKLKKSALDDQLMAHGRQMREQLLAILRYLHALYVLLKQTQDAPNHNRDDLVLRQIAGSLKPLRRLHAHNVAHYLQVLGADICHLPVCGSTKLRNLGKHHIT